MQKGMWGFEAAPHPTLPQQPLPRPRGHSNTLTARPAQLQRTTTCYSKVQLNSSTAHQAAGMCLLLGLTHSGDDAADVFIKPLQAHRAGGQLCGARGRLQPLLAPCPRPARNTTTRGCCCCNRRRLGRCTWSCRATVCRDVRCLATSQRCCIAAGRSTACLLLHLLLFAGAAACCLLLAAGADRSDLRRPCRCRCCF